MEPKRRLLLAAQPVDGGVPSHVLTLIDGLPRNRFSVAVACPPGSMLWERLRDRDDVELRPIGAHRRPAPGDARSLAALAGAVRTADVVHVHSAKAGFLGRLAVLLRGRRERTVFTPHGWSWWAASGPEAGLYRNLERLAARWCRTIVTLSAAEREAGLAAGVGRPAQYRVIPNGVELERFELPRRPVAGRIVMVGRLGPPKRPDLALRALAVLRERVPAARLQVVGDGPLRPTAEGLARELGLDGAVEFAGNRDDIPQLLAEAECAILASDYEGCPLAVIEAMAAGLPVVATDVGGIDELVEDGGTGFVSPANDAAGLAARIGDVLLDGELARQMGERASRVARERLSVAHMVDGLLSVYDEIDPI